MAIYSLRHSKIGRNTHAAGTAGAHLTYITRSKACRFVLGEHMPVPRPGKVEDAKAWMNQQESADRKNARVVDKFMLALPLELDSEQRMAVIQRFAERLTRGDAPWLAAIHDKGKDADNPHCHFVLRDRHIETGKRAIGMSEKGSTERVRELWEQVANEALEAAGIDARIDRRTLEAQGIDREPQKHIGSAAKAVEGDGRESMKLALIRDQERAADWHREAHSAPQGANMAMEAERAEEAQDAAERDLSKAKQNLRNADEILSGKRDLFTGELRKTDEAFVLPSVDGPDPTPEEEAEHQYQEFLASACDADGDEFTPNIKPLPSEYGASDRGRQIFERHLQEWSAAEDDRIARAEKNKRRIWEEEFPKKRQQLSEYSRMDGTQIVGKVLEAVRSIFQWMRDRVAAAKQTLGEKHDLTKQMQADWSEVIVENKKAHDIVLRDQQQITDAVKVQARQTSDLGEQRWEQVGDKRDAHRNPLRGPTKGDGPEFK